MGRPGFFVCACPDSELLRASIEKIIASAIPVETISTRSIFWGDSNTSSKDDNDNDDGNSRNNNGKDLPPQFWTALTLQTFETSVRVVILRNAQAVPIDTLRKLSKTLGIPNPQAFCILCIESAWEKGKLKLPAYIENLGCIKFARKNKWWDEVPPLNSQTLSSYINRIARELNLSLTPEAQKTLCAILTPDAVAVRSNLEMLALYAKSKQNTSVNAEPSNKFSIEKSNLSIISSTSDFNIFTFIKQIQSGNIAAAWKTASDETPDKIIFSFLGMLQFEARTMWRILSDEAPTYSQKDMQARSELARRIGTSGLAMLWDAILETESSIKSGHNTPEQALYLLIATMTRLFKLQADN